jgi:thioredoxin-related protein
MIKFSVNLHRGCFGGCAFCTISAHQGKFIVSRSKRSILEEVEKESGVKVCKINVDEEGALAMQYGVASIPMLVLFEKGKAQRTTLGYQSKEKVLQFIG